jgi:hypothetical protein
VDRKTSDRMVVALVPLYQAVLMATGALAIGFLASQACRTQAHARGSLLPGPISRHAPATRETRAREESSIKRTARSAARASFWESRDPNPRLLLAQVKEPE